MLQDKAQKVFMFLYLFAIISIVFSMQWMLQNVKNSIYSNSRLGKSDYQAFQLSASPIKMC